MKEEYCRRKKKSRMVSKYVHVCLLVRKESREIKSERVKMKSRGNCGKVKIVGHRKSVESREKTCIVPKIYSNYQKTVPFHLPFFATSCN